MELFDKIAAFISSEEVNQYKEKTTENLAEAILNLDVVSAGKQILSTGKLLLSIPDVIFWDKMRRFLLGSYSDFSQQMKMCGKFNDDDEQWRDFTKRQIYLINELDDDKKIDYFSNLTQAVLLELIDLPLYFKLANILKATTREELMYLSDHIKAETLLENVYVKALVSHGLIATITMDARGNLRLDGINRYGFTSLAYNLDKFAINFRNEDKYSYNGMTKMFDLR